MEALRRFWSERAPRERLTLAGAAALLLLVVVYLLLIEPAATGIPRLERTLPAARTQAVRLEQLLAEVTGLKARPQVAVAAPAEIRAALDRSLEAAGLKATRILPLTDGDLQISFANVPYAAFTSWLAAAERELGAKAGTVAARATDTPGAADIDVTLRVTRP